MPTRLIRDGIITSTTANRLTESELLFFILLMLTADDKGKFDAHPAVVRANVYPFRVDEVSKEDVSAKLKAVASVGLVRLYEVDGKPYGIIPKFGQRVRIKYDKFPDPPCENDGHMSDTCQTHDGHMSGTCQAHDGHMTARSRSESRSESESGSESEKANKLPKALPYPRSIEEIAQLMKSTASCGLRGEELEKCATRFFDTMEECGWRLRNGLPIADWRASARKYALSWQANIANRPIGAGKGAGRPAPRISNAGCNDPADYAQSGSKLSHDNNDPNAPF